MVDEARKSSMSRQIQKTLETGLQEEKMAYLSMESWVYNTVTLFTFALTVLLAITIPNITVVFGFMGAFAQSTLIYTLPAIFYLRTHQHSEESDKRTHYLAYGYVALGLFLFVFLTANQIL